jgi:hypothetical protein
MQQSLRIWRKRSSFEHLSDWKRGAALTRVQASAARGFWAGYLTGRGGDELPRGKLELKVAVSFTARYSAHVTPTVGQICCTNRST